MYTLDANILVRDLDTREPQHAECHASLEELQAQALPIIVPVLVLAEVAGIVSRTRRDPIAGRLGADLLRRIGNLSLIPIDETLAQEATELAADYALRGADATYVPWPASTTVPWCRSTASSANVLQPSSLPARRLRHWPTFSAAGRHGGRPLRHDSAMHPAIGAAGRHGGRPLRHDSAMHPVIGARHGHRRLSLRAGTGAGPYAMIRHRIRRSAPAMAIVDHRHRHDSAPHPMIGDAASIIVAGRYADLPLHHDSAMHTLIGIVPQRPSTSAAIREGREAHTDSKIRPRGSGGKIPCAYMKDGPDERI